MKKRLIHNLSPEEMDVLLDAICDEYYLSCSKDHDPDYLARHPDYPTCHLKHAELLQLVAKEGENISIILDDLLSFLKEQRAAFIDTRSHLLMDEKDPLVISLIKDCLDGQIKSLNNEIQRNNKLLMVAKSILPRAMEDHFFDLDEVRAVPIDTLIPLEKAMHRGQRTAALCPLHEEKTPSFVIYHDSNTAHCFGCGYHGDNIDLISRIHNLSFRDACRFILKA